MKSTMFNKAITVAVSASFAALLFTSNAKAAMGFATDFESYAAASLSDQNGWTTNDPFDGVNGGSDFVITGNSADNTTQIGQIGGIFRSTDPMADGAPNRGDVTVTHGFDDPLAGGLGIAFDVDFAITSSSTDFPSKDEFGFTFLIGNTVYASLLFTPQTQVAFGGGDPDNANNKLDITLTYGTNSTLSSVQAIVYNSFIHLTLLVDLQNSLKVTLDGLNVFDPAVLYDPSAVDPSQIATFGAVWNLKNPTPGNPTAQTGAGTNSIEIDNVSVVPEPSTTALLIIAGIGGAAFAARRRHARA